MSHTVGFAEVARDGILDYPLFPGQTLGGGNSVWRVAADPQGPAVSAQAGFLHYSVSNQPVANQRVQVSISTPLPVKPVAFLVFRVRATTIQGPGVTLSLPGGIMLSFETNGTTANWKWSDGTTTRTLAPSSIGPDGRWRDITMGFGCSPGSVSLFEDGVYRFYQLIQAIDPITPVFDMRVPGQGSSLSIDVGGIYAVPPLFAPGVNTPWDYSVKEGIAPSDLAMIFDTADGGPQVTFGEGYARFFVDRAGADLTVASLTVPQDAPAVASVSYRIRVNVSGHDVTSIALPGGNVLMLTQGGQTAAWYKEDRTLLATSSIRAGAPDFTIVTLVTSPTTLSLIENGVYKYSRAYPETASWPVKLVIQHIGTGGGVSVDAGGVRVLPGIKPPELLATDLQDSLLAYFPLKGTLENLAGTTGPLVPANGTPAYVDGRFGKAVSFAGGKMTLSIPELPVAASPSYTLSAWVLVNGYPPADSLTGITGPLLLDSTGRLQYLFIFNNQRSYQQQFFRSARALSTGQWHSVAVTYSYEEARLAIFIDGALDSVSYLGSETASISAIVPACFSVGGYQADYSHPAVVLNGAVGDIFVFSQHVHQPTAEMLANTSQAGGDQAAPRVLGELAFLAFLTVLYGVYRTAAEHMIAEQIPQPQPPQPLPLPSYVKAICDAVGTPAVPGKYVSRFDIGMRPGYTVLLDIGGEGVVDLGGFFTGVKEAINVNAPLKAGDPRPPTVTAPGPLHRKPIPGLVELQPWSTDPGFPFADGFADRLAMINEPLTDKKVSEIARVIRNGGTINLWIDTAAYGGKMADLAARLNSVAEPAAETPGFQKNVPSPKDELRRAAPSDDASSWPRRHRIVARKPAVIFYATQFDDVRPLVESARDGYITHVLLGLFHLGYDKVTSKPYIHLNEEDPDHEIFKHLWPAIRQVQSYGVRVLASLGGYMVEDYTNLFKNESTYNMFYGLFRAAVRTYNLDGVDLDIEESDPVVSTDNIRRLVADIRRDFRYFPRGFLISSAPVASALTSKRSMSVHVDYPALFDIFDFYCLQFYNDYGQLNPKARKMPDTPTYAEIVAKYQGRQHRLIAGTVTNSTQGRGYISISDLVPILADLKDKFRGFGGLFGWNYQHALAGSPAVTDPYKWAQTAATALGIKPVLKGGQITAMTTDDAYPRVYYTDASMSVHELAYSRSATWGDRNITALAGSAGVNPLSTLTCCLTIGRAPQVFYAGGDEHMHQLSADNTDPQTAWQDTDLTTYIKATATLTGNAISAVLGSSYKYPRVYYAAGDQDVHSFYFQGAWHEEDDTSITRGPKYLIGTAISAVNIGIDNPCAYYTGSDRHMHELAFRPPWTDSDLTKITGTQAVPAARAISAIIGTSSSYPRVYYITADWHVHSFFYNGSWHEEDDTVLGRGPDAAADSSVSAVNVGDDRPRVYYVSVDRHVHELAYTSSGWHDTDVTAAAGSSVPGPPSGRLSATTVAGAGERLPRIYYVTEERRVRELWYDGAGHWNAHDLTT